jgi:hypothetical protein
MTIEADSIVAANDASAFRAFPLLLFFFQEALNAVFIDRYQVLDHAHVIEITVSLVECPEAAAWKIVTLIAEVHQPFSQQVTVLAHVHAVPAAWPATGTIGLMKTLGSQVVSHCQVVGAYTAVHPARGNEFCTHSL